MATGSLFVYGTLLCDDILVAVARAGRRAGEARLSGYRRLRIREEQYPAIIPDPGAETEGIVYDGLDHSAFARLDRFEGQDYERQRVNVTLHDGAVILADTYVLKPKFHHLLDDEEWDFDDFLKNGKPLFIASYLGFHTNKE